MALEHVGIFWLAGTSMLLQLQTEEDDDGATLVDDQLSTYRTTIENSAVHRASLEDDETYLVMFDVCCVCYSFVARCYWCN